MEHNTKKVSKGLLQSDELYQYILETSVYPREPEPLKELREATASHPRAEMATSPDAGQLMTMLLGLVDAKKTIEVGVFTGYSLLLTALAIPEDGKIVAIDVNREPYDQIGFPIIKKAGVEHKIDLIESEALPVLDKLLEQHGNEGSFDFAFVDADKVNYWNYHERLMKLLKVGGIAVYDNTLWGGSVVMPHESTPEFMKPGRQYTIELNKSLADDPRREMGSNKRKVLKGLLQSDDLYEYILETSVYPREPEPLKELRKATASHPWAGMGTAPDAGQLMTMLLGLVDAKKTIEVGVFTGYSLLLTALTIPEDGKIVAIDAHREPYDQIGLPIIKKSGVEHKIELIESEALPVLDKLVEQHENEGSFDFAFVDADKENYCNYHERIMKLVKVGGIAVYDNTLWGGSVAMPIKYIPEGRKPGRQSMIELNKLLAADTRVQISHASVGDGITICRRLH
ncbi:hypothetical protein ACLB2K_002991 [Fragaria x ananassa]